MPKAGRSNYVVLMDRSGNSKTGLRPLTDAEGRLQYSWELAPGMTPQLSPEDVSYGQFREDQELVWSVNDWSRGALKFYENPRDPGFYAITDKCWAATPNEVSLGPEPIPQPFSIPNGGAELAATTNFTASGVTLTAVSTAPYAGNYHFQMASTSTNDYISHSLENVARWRGLGCSVTAKVRGSSAGGQVRMQIIESGGSSTPTTSGDAVTLTTSYQSINATVDIQSDSTGIAVRVQCSADGGSDRTVYVDLVQAHVTKSGTEGQNANHCRMLTTTQGLHCVTATAIYIFDETSDYWQMRKGFDNPITGLEVFDNRIFVGLGESTAYQYSDVGDSTSWNAHGGSGTQDNANYFTKVLNANGNWALAKTLNDDDVHLATDPTDTAGWGSAIEVGKDDHVIRNVYGLEGTMAVGKDDGFYRYARAEGNQFTNVKPDAEFSADSNNFSRGIMYGGWFYTVQAEIGLMRYNGQSWQDLGHLLQSPGFDDFGTRARAFGTDGRTLYVLIEDLNSASISKKSWLYALKEFQDGSWSVHQVASLLLSDATDIFIFRPAGASNNFIFISGENTSDEAMSYRLQLPDRTDTPRLATNAAVALSGTIITSWWDGGRPAVNKSFDKFTLISENLSGTKTVTVAYMVDNETSFTNISSGGAVFNGSPSGTLRFNEGVTGRRIRLRITLATDSSTSAPVVKGFGLHISWRPDRLRRWRILAEVADDVRTLQGVRHALPASRMMAQLGILQREANPIQLEDIDGNSYRAHIISMQEAQVQVHLNGGYPRYNRGVELVLVESLGLTGWTYQRWNEFTWS